MSDPTCELLDGYLDRALTVAEHDAFAVHLSRCSACRQAIEEQTRMAQLLRQATTELGPVPTGLAERIEQRLRAARRRRAVRWIGGLAAAAVLLGLLLGGWWWLRTPGTPSPEPPRVEAPSEPPAPAAVVHVSFPQQRDLLIMPMPTESPNVTIIWVYPAVKPPARASASSSEPASEPERNGS